MRGLNPDNPLDALFRYNPFRRSDQWESVLETAPPKAQHP